MAVKRFFPHWRWPTTKEMKSYQYTHNKQRSTHTHRHSHTHIQVQLGKRNK